MKISWRELNYNLNSYSEAQVLDMLNEERAVHKRATMLQRLHQRYNALRVARERLEIMAEATQP